MDKIDPGLIDVINRSNIQIKINIGVFNGEFSTIKEGPRNNMSFLFHIVQAIKSGHDPIRFIILLAEMGFEAEKNVDRERLFVKYSRPKGYATSIANKNGTR